VPLLSKQARRHRALGARPAAAATEPRKTSAHSHIAQHIASLKPGDTLEAKGPIMKLAIT